MNKNTAILTCSMISLLLAQTNVLANNDTSKEEDVQKEETVYAILSADGSVQERIISGHIHNGSGIKNISETLDIENVENIKGSEKPQINNQTYTWNSKDSDIYYQGTSDKQLPIEINIQYLLNGIEYKPEDLAGKSGKLEIRISFQNTIGKQVMIQGMSTTIHPLYIAVGAVDLNNDHFHNVICENGKILSDGNQQLVSFFSLPGFADTLKSAGITQSEALSISDSFVIHADVEQFEMNPIMIAMTPEVPLDQLKDINTLDELTDGIGKLTDSGLQLLDGTKQLSDATGLFAAKMNELQVKTTPLASGITQLSNGIGQLYSGSNEITTNMKSLSEGLAQIKSGAQKLSDGTAELPKLSEGIKQLQQGASQLNSAVQTLSEGIGTMHSNAVASNQLNQLAALLTKLESFEDTLKQMEQLFTALDALNTSLNIGNQNPADPNMPLPSISDYTKAAASESQSNVQKINTLCNHLKSTGADADILNECNEAAQYSMNHAQNAAVLNMIMNGTQENGLAQQVAEMNQMLKQFDMDSFQQLSDQFASLPVAIEGLHELNNGIDALNQAMPQLTAGFGSLKGGIDLLAANGNQLSALSLGIEQLNQGSTALYDGSKQLYQGNQTLSTSLKKVNTGIQALHTNTPSLISGIQQLNSASNTLADKTSQLNQGMQLFQSSGLDQLQNKVSLSTDEINRIMAIKDAVVSENEQVHSFTGAPENAESKVKFIYKTAAVEQPKAEAVQKTESEDEQSFWDKVVSFFSNLF